MEQMTFLLSTRQADRLRAALQAMMDNGMADEEAKADGLNENSNGNALAAVVRYYEARAADDAAGPPPCGGDRCHRADDGTWIHSSKSYGTCSEQRKGPPA